MKALSCLVWLFVVISSINVGILGIFSYNVVAMIFVSAPIVTKILYILVGLSGLYLLCKCKSCCK